MRSADCRQERFSKVWSVRAVALTLLFAALLSGAVSAAPRGRSRDDLRETITLLMMVRMKNELGLTSQQYEQVLPKVEERERARAANARDRRARLATLRGILKTARVTKDSELTEAVEGILALDDADRRQDASFVADMRKILSPRQQGQLLLFRQRFRNWLETRVRDAQELRRGYGRRGMGGRGAGAPQGGDEDEDAGPDGTDRP